MKNTYKKALNGLLVLFSMLYTASGLGMENKETPLRKNYSIERNVLFNFIAHNDHTSVKKLIKEGATNLESYNDEGLTPLMYATLQGNAYIVSLLLKSKCNPMKRGKWESQYDSCDALDLAIGNHVSSTHSLGLAQFMLSDLPTFLKPNTKNRLIFEKSAEKASQMIYLYEEVIGELEQAYIKYEKEHPSCITTLYNAEAQTYSYAFKTNYDTVKPCVADRIKGWKNILTARQYMENQNIFIKLETFACTIIGLPTSPSLRLIQATLEDLSQRSRL